MPIFAMVNRLAIDEAPTSLAALAPAACFPDHYLVCDPTC